jgi:hypothetical protein
MNRGPRFADITRRERNTLPPKENMEEMSGNIESKVQGLGYIPKEALAYVQLEKLTKSLVKRSPA